MLKNDPGSRKQAFTIQSLHISAYLASEINKTDRGLDYFEQMFIHGKETSTVWPFQPCWQRQNGIHLLETVARQTQCWHFLTVRAIKYLHSLYQERYWVYLCLALNRRLNSFFPGQVLIQLLKKSSCVQADSKTLHNIKPHHSPPFQVKSSITYLQTQFRIQDWWPLLSTVCLCSVRWVLKYLVALHREKWTINTGCSEYGYSVIVGFGVSYCLHSLPHRAVSSRNGPQFTISLEGQFYLDIWSFNSIISNTCSHKYNGKKTTLTY